MHILAIFLLFAVAGQCTYAHYADDLENGIARKHVARIFGGKIKDGLEKFKKQIKTGNEALNVPKLDPLDSDYREIVVDDKVIKGVGKFSNIHIDGLSDFIVKKADYELFKSTLVVDLVWSHIKGNVLYDVNATAIDKYPVFGAGNLSFELQNFNLASKIKVKLATTKITVVSFSDTKISLEKIKVEISGLFNEEELSQEVSSTVSELAPEILDNFQNEITTKFNTLMPTLSNKILEKIDIWKFIDI